MATNIVATNIVATNVVATNIVHLARAESTGAREIKTLSTVMVLASSIAFLAISHSIAVLERCRLRYLELHDAEALP